jgi:hypothetical protein
VQYQSSSTGLGWQAGRDSAQGPDRAADQLQEQLLPGGAAGPGDLEQGGGWDQGAAGGAGSSWSGPDSCSSVWPPAKQQLEPEKPRSAARPKGLPAATETGAAAVDGEDSSDWPTADSARSGQEVATLLQVMPLACL